MIVYFEVPEDKREEVKQRFNTILQKIIWFYKDIKFIPNIKYELEDIKKEKEQEIQRLSEIAKKMSRHYKLFSIAKFELAKYGISMENKSVCGLCKGE